MKYFLIVITALLFSSCSTKYIFVIQRDVPKNPVFTVIPANNTMFEVTFASKVEQYLMYSGVKIISPPATKQIESKKTLGGSNANIQGKQSGVGVEQNDGAQSLVESYFAYEETNANYLVRTLAWSRGITISDKSTNEILANFSFPSDISNTEDAVFENEKTLVYNTMKELGLTVKQYK